MGRGPTKSNENVYFVARKKAAMYNERLYSREGAAELLGISVSTLADYELGNTKVVPVDKVVLMADLVYTEDTVSDAKNDRAALARAGTRADLNSYITSNRGEEAAALAEGRKIKRPSESKLAPIACSMLPRDYEITEKSKVQIISIKAAEAQYYRQLWTHNFVGSSATFNRAVLIDGMVSGVFGISKMQATSLFIWYVMKVPHTTYRLGRLLYMLAQNHCFTETLLDDLEREKVTKVRTAMLTKYPENKEVRGIMKLVNRQKDKNNGFKLTYEAELTDRTEQETLEEWLRRERQWQKSRKQNMK